LTIFGLVVILIFQRLASKTNQFKPQTWRNSPQTFGMHARTDTQTDGQPRKHNASTI